MTIKYKNRKGLEFIIDVQVEGGRFYRSSAEAVLQHGHKCCQGGTSSIPIRIRKGHRAVRLQFLGGGDKEHIRHHVPGNRLSTEFQAGGRGGGNRYPHDPRGKGRGYRPCNRIRCIYALIRISA
ncbi:C1 protein [Sida yellow vein virus satellite DNA beta]|uniref:C1 protein n=1 Tax=Sida yellow vein virus satellite DNA beta TaxID=326489 RepID=Q4GZI2_9VIRU|nr:C1 protein [Sida yellow vein virus satellite DNA beta]CAI91195.1 C1 protein [Sida yellow vein virus satellite DNA beta]